MNKDIIQYEKNYVEHFVDITDKLYKIRDIKHWINNAAKRFNTVIFYKRTDTMHVIVVPFSVESDAEFRDIALDFLISFDEKYEEDIIIVSDKDNFYSFDAYDYDTSQRLLEEDFLFVTYSAITEKVNSSVYDDNHNGQLYRLNTKGIITVNIKPSNKILPRSISGNLNIQKESCVLV